MGMTRKPDRASSGFVMLIGPSDYVEPQLDVVAGGASEGLLDVGQVHAEADVLPDGLAGEDFAREASGGVIELEEQALGGGAHLRNAWTIPE